MFRTANGEQVSEKTIRFCCHRSGIRNYVAVSKPYLSLTHLAAKLSWATTRRNRSVFDWET